MKYKTKTFNRSICLILAVIFTMININSYVYAADTPTTYEYEGIHYTYNEKKGYWTCNGCDDGLKKVVILDIIDDIPVCEVQEKPGIGISFSSSVEEFYISKNIKKINPSAISYITLEKFSIDSENEFFAVEDGILFNKDKTELIRYPASKSGASYIIPDGIKKISKNAFSSCTLLTNVEFPANLDQIGDYAFFNCSNLEEVDLSKGCKAIRSFAFMGWENNQIKRVIFPSDLETIYNGAFSECNSLKEIVFPETLDNFKSDSSSGVFKNCTALEYVEIPNGVTDVYWFEGCTNLKKITLAKNAKVTQQLNDDNSKFEGYVVDKDNPYLTVVDGVLYSKNMDTVYVYPGTKKDVTYAIPSTVKTILHQAFANADNLISVDINSEIDFFGTHVFSGCDNLESVYLSENTIKQSSVPSYKIFGEFAPFSSCPKLTVYCYKDSYAQTLFDRYNNMSDEEMYPYDLRVNYKTYEAPKVNGEKSVSVDEGKDAVISVEATDGVPEVYEYQWYYIDETTGDSVEIENATFASYTIDGDEVTEIINGRQYYCVVKSVRLETASEKIVLHVEHEEPVIKYEEPVFKWSEDGKTCSVVRTSTNVPGTVATYSAEVTSKVKTPATCVEKGITLYTATYETYTDTKEIQDIPINASNHVGGTETKNTVEPTIYSTGYTGDICCKSCREVITYGTVIPKLKAIDYKDFTYSFGNSKRAFEYPEGYHIPLERFQAIFGNSQRALDLYEVYGEWGGSCYGMAATSGMFNKENNGVDVTQYNNAAKKVSELKISDKNNHLGLNVRQFIETMHVSQSDYMAQRVKNKNKGKLSEICEMAREAEETHKPIIISVRRSATNGHAILGYGLEDVDGTISRLHVYDCNYPNTDRYIEITKDAKGNYVKWYYYYNNKYHTGTDYVGTSISYTPYDVYYSVWENRAGSKEEMDTNLVMLNTENAEIYNNAGRKVAEVVNGIMVANQEDIIPIEMLDSDYDDNTVDRDPSFYVPSGTYTLKNKDTSSKDFIARMVDTKLGISVTTTADEITLTVNDDAQKQFVSVDAEKNDTYEIDLNVSSGTENNAVKLTGTGSSAPVEITQEQGSILMKNISDAKIEVDNQAKEYVQITATATEGGTITPQGKAYTVKNDSITYKMTPNEGYVIKDVQIDGKSIGAVSTYTFKDIISEHSLYVIFTKKGTSKNTIAPVYPIVQVGPTGPTNVTSNTTTPSSGGTSSGTNTSFDNGTSTNNSDTGTATDRQKKKFTTGSGSNKITYKITSTSNLTASVSSVAKSAKTVKIPSSVTDASTGVTYKVTGVAKNALKSRTKLTTLTIGRNVKTIGTTALSGCTKLSNVTIYADSLTKVGKNAFKGIKSGAVIRVEAKNKTHYNKIKKILKNSGIQKVKYKYRFK